MRAFYVIPLLTISAASAALLMLASAEDAERDTESLSLSVTPAETDAGDSDPGPLPVASDPLASTALRAGLHPEALAAVGVPSSQVPAILGAFETEQARDASALAAADADYAGQRAEVDRLRRLIRARKGSPEDVQAKVASLATCQSACDSAQAARDARLDELFAAATSGLTAAQIAALETYRTNRADWRFPAQYMVVERSQEDWVRLRECLGNEAKAPEIGDPLDSDCQTWLATIRANTNVAAATTNVASNGVAVEYAWNLHFSD